MELLHALLSILMMRVMRTRAIMTFPSQDTVGHSLQSFCTLGTSSAFQPREDTKITIPILQRTKLRPGEGKDLLKFTQQVSSRAGLGPQFDTRPGSALAPLTVWTH